LALDPVGLLHAGAYPLRPLVEDIQERLVREAPEQKDQDDER